MYMVYICDLSTTMGLSGLEPPTSRLSGVRSNQLSYKPVGSRSHLLSRSVSRQVPSAVPVLTVVFGMGTGVSPARIATRNIYFSDFDKQTATHPLLILSLERR